MFCLYHFSGPAPPLPLLASDEYLRELFNAHPCEVDETKLTKNMVNTLYRDTDSELTDSDGFSANEFFVICDDNKAYQYSKNDDLDEFVTKERLRIYTDLKNQCGTWNMYHTDFSNHYTGRDAFSLIRTSKSLRYVECCDSDVPKLKRAVSVRSDLSVAVAVQDRILPANHVLWESVPRTCANVKTLEKILTAVANFKVCIGNPDKDLQTLIPFDAYLDSSGPKYLGYHDWYLDSTIRSTKCAGLSTGERCVPCQTYRRTLRKLKQRRQSSEVATTDTMNWLSSKTPNSRLTNSQKFHKLKQMRTYISDLERENGRLKNERRRIIKKDCVDQLNLSAEENAMILLRAAESQVLATFAEDTKRIFEFEPDDDIPLSKRQYTTTD